MTSITRSAALRPIYELFGEGTLTGLSDEQLVTRFVASRDERAFEALLIRHGRSVLAVCVDVLRDGHDAEDAFQATFLILARKAGSLWVGGSLAAWLHRVARRVSVEANLRKARRRRFENTGRELDTAGLEPGSPWKTSLEILHEEIDRLPEKYRAPIILCDLESLTRDEAAHQLGWQPGTVAGRLARARSILRDRIARRINVEAGGLITVVAARRAAGPEVPWSFIKKTVNLPISRSTSTMTNTGLLSVGGAELARRVARAMLLAKLKYSAVMSLAAGLGLAVVASSLAGGRPETTPVAGASLPAERTQVRSAGGQPDAAPARVPLAGAILLQGGSPAKGAAFSFRRSITRMLMASFAPRRSPATAERSTLISHQWTFLGPVFSAPVRSGRTGRARSWHGCRFIGALFRLVCPSSSCWGRRPARPFEVFGPDGKAVAGAMIEPRVLARNYSQVPDRLASLIGAETVTDARGRAVMTAFFPDEITAIRVTAEGYGQQEFSFGPERFDNETKVVRLRPVGGLKGRVVGDPDAMRRRPLSVASFSAPDDPLQRLLLTHDIH